MCGLYFDLKLICLINNFRKNKKLKYTCNSKKNHI